MSTQDQFTWNPSTREAYDDALDALPPADMYRGGFLLGEPMDHNDEGRPRFTAYRQRIIAATEQSAETTIYEYGSHVVTRAEFRKVMDL